MEVLISREDSMTLDLTEVSDRELVWEIYRRIKGDSEQHYHRNYGRGACPVPIPPNRVNQRRIGGPASPHA